MSSIAGYKNREEAIINIVQTLNNLLTKWPRETFSGFMVHFSNRNLDALSEFSSIDSTIAVLGALFAGNYFGGEVTLLMLKHFLIFFYQVLDLALQLRDATQWSDAIKAADNSRIYPVVNPDTGVFSGTIRLKPNQTVTKL